METAAFVLMVSTFFGLAALELVRPARQFPRIKGWRLKGIAFFVLNIAVTATLPLAWDTFLGEHRLIDATGLGTWAGGLLGLVVLDLVVYAWHRTMHNVSFLWRWFHQMHHSAERVDVYGAAYFHPLDMAGFAFVTSFALVMLLGVTPEAALLANLLGTLFSIFQHGNVRTPQWLGYVIQRPENHSLHHERGLHGFNYGNLALWDMVFGTFKNPATWAGEAGFFDGASKRVGAMLIGRDLVKAQEAHETPREDASCATSVSRRGVSSSPTANSPLLAAAHSQGGELRFSPLTPQRPSTGSRPQS